VVQSARPYGQRAVLKFAHYTGCKALAGRHTPGAFVEGVSLDQGGANVETSGGEDRVQSGGGLGVVVPQPVSLRNERSRKLVI